MKRFAPRKNGKLQIRARNKTPIEHFMLLADLRRCDVASRAAVSVPTVAKLCTDADNLYGCQLSSLLAVSNALGCSLVELLPVLAKRPKQGLLWERGVFREKTHS